MKPKMAALEAIPRDSVTTAAAVNPGLRASILIAWSRSCFRLFMGDLAEQSSCGCKRCAIGDEAPGQAATARVASGSPQARAAPPVDSVDAPSQKRTGSVRERP